MRRINEIFNGKVMGELDAALKTFSETSEKNLSMQKNLFPTTAQLIKVIAQADESIRQMQNVTENFGKFSEDALNKNISLLQNHINNLAHLEQNFSAEIQKINNVALNVALDTKQYLNDFNTTSKESMQVIRDTIAHYKTDLNAETEKSLSKLHQLFETVAKNTDEQSDKAIQNQRIQARRHCAARCKD